jgi:16S rRNA (adenine1518-N6/adenine1519-N6)-dimethyltransferase
MVLMVQKEVAQRICTAPPNMSLLSVAVQFYAQPKIISNVSKNAFYPVPKIDSAILRIKPQISNVGRRTSHIDTKRFFGLVKAGFANKRKFLINNLSRELKIENCKLKIIFDQIKIDQTSRAEELSVDNWIELSTILTNKNLL